MVDETKIELYLKANIEKRGGLSYKFVSPGRKNVPDRLCVCPGVAPFFVEAKKPGAPLRPGQEREHARLHHRGAVVFTASSYEDMDRVLAWLDKQLNHHA